MVLLPRVGHDLPGYGLRKVLDYFVVHLAGMEPPADFMPKTGSELEAERRSATVRP
jgi:hypothetical protein